MAVIHIHIGLHISDAHVETETQEPRRDGLNRRAGIRKNADVPRLITSAQCIDVGLGDVHIR